MNYYNSKGIASIVLIGAIVVGCVVVGMVSDKFLGKDNQVEQVAEEVIQLETGLDVDLSPDR